MKRAVWAFVFATGLLTLCLIGWSVIETIRWVGSLTSCV